MEVEVRSAELEVESVEEEVSRPWLVVFTIFVPSGAMLVWVAMPVVALGRVAMLRLWRPKLAEPLTRPLMAR